MAHRIEKGWGDYNGSIIYVTYSEEKQAYLEDGDDVNIIPVSEIKPIRLDDSRISNFRISPPLSESNSNEGTESSCFLEESFEYSGKQRFVFEILREGIMKYVDELQKHLIKQGVDVMGY